MPVAPAPGWTARDERWSVWLANPEFLWASLCTAEDWIRIHFLAPRARCDWNRLFLHSPLATCAKLAAMPISPIALEAAESGGTTLEVAVLLRGLHTRELSTLIPHISDVIWHFMARWLCSLPANSPHVRVRYTSKKGLGLYSPAGLPDPGPVPGLWGLPFPIPTDILQTLLDEGSSFTIRTFLTADKPGDPEVLGPPHVILGPLNLANHACPSHSTIIPD